MLVKMSKIVLRTIWSKNDFYEFLFFFLTGCVFELILLLFMDSLSSENVSKDSNIPDVDKEWGSCDTDSCNADTSISDLGSLPDSDTLSDTSSEISGHDEKRVRLNGKSHVQLWRTKLCPEWSDRGTCSNGDMCGYAHGTKQLHCYYYQAGLDCKFGARCRKIHDVRPVVEPFRYSICRKWRATGQACFPDCGFAHGNAFVICRRYHQNGRCSFVTTGSGRCKDGLHIHHTQPGGSRAPVMNFSFGAPLTGFTFGPAVMAPLPFQSAFK